MSVNKFAYIVLALFLGFIGVHKFYEGKYGMGLLYLLFSWTGIPEILAIIDLVIAIFAPTDGAGNFLYRHRY